MPSPKTEPHRHLVQVLEHAIVARRHLQRYRQNETSARIKREEAEVAFWATSI